MDAVKRHYAHTAWTSADPLKDLAPEVKRSILLMKPTVRERLRLAPWRDDNQRRMALGHILSERRLAFELSREALEPQKAAPLILRAAPEAAAKPLGPYYQRRLDTDRQALAQLVGSRERQTLKERSLPGARALEERDAARRREWMELELDRARLAVRELEHDLAREAVPLLPDPHDHDLDARDR